MPAMVAKKAERTAAAAGEVPHFLVVTYPAQGHINPARHLALRLLRATPGARVTLSTAVSACRKMFPDAGEAEEHMDGAGVRYVPYSDGFDGLPVPSPDGTQLAWTSSRSGGGAGQIFLAQWNHEAALAAIRNAPARRAR
jgi:hypothetical protein